MHFLKSNGRRAMMLRPRCLVVPSYPPHYALLARLLHSLKLLAADAPPPIVIVFSNGTDMAADLQSVCANASGACDHLQLEPTTIDKLLSRQAAAEASHANVASLPRAEPDDERRRTKPKKLTWSAYIEKGEWEKRFGRHKTSLPTWQSHFSFSLQALKKLLGVRFSGCQTSWVLDSEAQAIAPFSFDAIFGGWERQPVAYSVRHAGWHADMWTRQHQLASINDEWEAKPAQLLGVSDREIRIRMVEQTAGRHEDYWMWDGSAMDRLMRRVAHVHNGSFLDAYLRYPTSELRLYYGYEQYVDPTPAVTVRFIEDVVADFYNTSILPMSTNRRVVKRTPHLNLIIGANATKAGRGIMLGAPKATTRRKEHASALRPSYIIEDGFPRACELIELLGYRAMKPGPYWLGQPRKLADAKYEPATVGAAARARQCRAGWDGNRQLIAFWLGEKANDAR